MSLQVTTLVHRRYVTIRKRASMVRRYQTFFFFFFCVQCFRASIPPAVTWCLLFCDRWIWDLWRHHAHKFGSVPYTYMKGSQAQTSLLHKIKIKCCSQLSSPSGEWMCPSPKPNFHEVAYIFYLAWVRCVLAGAKFRPTQTALDLELYCTNSYVDQVVIMLKHHYGPTLLYIKNDHQMKCFTI